MGRRLLARMCAEVRTVLFLPRAVLLTVLVSDRRDFYMDAPHLQGIFSAVQTREVAVLYPAVHAANAAGPDEIR